MAGAISSDADLRSRLTYHTVPGDHNCMFASLACATFNLSPALDAQRLVKLSAVMRKVIAAYQLRYDVHAPTHLKDVDTIFLVQALRLFGNSNPTWQDELKNRVQFAHRNHFSYDDTIQDAAWKLSQTIVSREMAKSTRRPNPVWGSESELAVASLVLGIPIYSLVMTNNKLEGWMFLNGAETYEEHAQLKQHLLSPTRKIIVCFVGGNHYDVCLQRGFTQPVRLSAFEAALFLNLADDPLLESTVNVSVLLNNLSSQEFDDAFGSITTRRSEITKRVTTAVMKASAPSNLCK